MEFWIPLVAALAGSLIGAMASVVTVIVQARKEDKRHARDIAVQLATIEYQDHLERAKVRSSVMPPITVYLAYHLKAVSLAAKGELTADDFAALKELRAMLKTLD